MRSIEEIMLGPPAEPYRHPRTGEPVVDDERGYPVPVQVAQRPVAGAEATSVPLPSVELAIDGAAFVFGAPTEVPAIWGAGEDVAWAEGESLLIVGPAGVGKSTVAQQLILARLGLRDEVLGMRVTTEARQVLYVAADRPSQAARSLRRMVSEDQAPTLEERLKVWRGPLPQDLAAHPDALLTLANQYDAGTVVLDSLKDVALDLSKDETGSRLNHAFQKALAGGVEILALHHQRKAQGMAKPRSLEDVYGSTWITAGAGSVVLLWGEAGGPVVTLSHLKQPSGEVGPLTVIHDHHAGTTEAMRELDAYTLVMASPDGVTVKDVAARLYGKSDQNEIEKARRKLDGLWRVGKIHRQGGKRGGSEGGEATRYYRLERSRSDHAGGSETTDHEATTLDLQDEGNRW